MMKQLHNARYSMWLMVLCCLIGVGSAAQSPPRPLHVVAGIHAGPAIMLAPFEYTRPSPELLQPSPRPGYSFYNAFVGVEFAGNEILFSYGDLPMAAGYAIYNANKGVTRRDNGLVALNSFFALTYKRKVWTGLIPFINRRKAWSVYVGGYVGMFNSPSGLGGPSSVKSISQGKVNFEIRSSLLFKRGPRDYFVSFGPEAQLRCHVSNFFAVFINTGLRITPQVVQSYRIEYNFYQRPDDTFKTTDVHSRVINLYFSFGILFDVRIGKRVEASSISL